MARNKKRATKANPRKVAHRTQERGLDLGDQPKVIVLTDASFNEALTSCGIFACAYGYHALEGTGQSVPCITLVGKNRAGFAKVYEHFARWDCDIDGDVVDIRLLLKSNGTYEMWIGPETQRALYRTLPHADLFRAMSLNVSWVKQFDSTHEMVQEIRNYVGFGIHPVVVAAAVANPIHLSINALTPVLEWKPLVKFRLIILDEKDSQADLCFSDRLDHASHLGGPPDHEPPTGEQVCNRRSRVIDYSFAVSRERVRRSDLVRSVRALHGFESVGESQVTQAAVNLLLSAEIAPGDRHYSRLTGNHVKKVWDAIAGHWESADGGSEPGNLSAALVAKQLELDVREMLRKARLLKASATFSEAQEAFRKAGYVND